jgi:hypothetical protein
MPACELDTQVGSPSASPSSPVVAAASSGIRSADIADIAVRCGVALLLTTLALVLLGDVVVSRSVIQCDLGKRYPKRHNRGQSQQSRPNKDIRSLLAILET